ncbi:MAG: glycosyltransferase family 2 protein [Candidatus Aminicenantia bacterium]
MRNNDIYLSIIIPVYNEQENLRELHQEIKNVLDKFKKNYEIIFVDDGSVDNSFSLLKQIHKENSRVKVIRLRKNFGQTAALSAGFDYLRGKMVVTMDGDLQNDPKDIPLLINKLEEGYDIVSGWRYKRKDKFFTRRLPSAIANWLISLITGIKLHDYGCTLKAFRKEVVKSIKLYGEMHRFIPAMASLIGVNIAEIKVNHRARKSGKSKYGLSRTIKVVLDLVTVKFLLSYSTRPLQVFGLVGLICGLIGGILGIYLSYQRLILKSIGLANRPLLLLAILLIFMGFQFITLGLLAEMISRAYHESVRKKIYSIREIIK